MWRQQNKPIWGIFFNNVVFTGPISAINSDYTEETSKKTTKICPNQVKITVNHLRGNSGENVAF